MKKAYEDGLCEAWDLARRIALGKEHGGFSLAELEKIFKVERRKDVFMLFTPQKAADCIALWENRQKIRVGDVLFDKALGEEAVVSHVSSKNIFVIFSDGSCGECAENDFTKAGRTVDVEAFLAQIGGTENV